MIILPMIALLNLDVAPPVIGIPPMSNAFNAFTVNQAPVEEDAVPALNNAKIATMAHITPIIINPRILTHVTEMPFCLANSGFAPTILHSFPTLDFSKNRYPIIMIAPSVINRSVTLSSYVK